MLRAIDRVAAMTQKQKAPLTRNPDATDPITAEALVTAPESLTGISKMHRHQLIDRALQAQHGVATRLTTPLFDTKLFTKHIEAAYIMMYERHQAGLAPDHITVLN